MQQHPGAARREAPSRQRQLALLPSADALGNAVNEQIDDFVLQEKEDKMGKAASRIPWTGSGWCQVNTLSVHTLEG